MLFLNVSSAGITDRQHAADSRISPADLLIAAAWIDGINSYSALRPDWYKKVNQLAQYGRAAFCLTAYQSCNEPRKVARPFSLLRYTLIRVEDSSGRTLEYRMAKHWKK